MISGKKGISKKSQNYGQALFESESSEQMLIQFKTLSKIFSQKEVLKFFCAFTISLEDKKKLLNLSLKRIFPLLKAFFFVLLENKAFFLLPQIVRVYEGLWEEKQGLCKGTVYSSSPLSQKQKKEIEALLQNFFNKKLELNQKEDKKLIGGIFVKVGNYIFNNTVKQDLKQFKNLGG